MGIWKRGGGGGGGGGRPGCNPGVKQVLVCRGQARHRPGMTIGFGERESEAERER